MEEFLNPFLEVAPPAGTSPTNPYDPVSFSLKAQQLIQLIRWSYFCTWKPCDAATRLTFEGGHWNALLKDEQKLGQIKQLMHRYTTHCSALPLSGAGTAGIVMQTRVPQWSSAEDDSDMGLPNLIRQAASIKTLLWIPIEGGVLELGNADMVEEQPIVLAQVLEFLHRGNTCNNSTTIMRPLITNLALVPPPVPSLDIDSIDFNAHISLRDNLHFDNDPTINMVGDNELYQSIVEVNDFSLMHMEPNQVNGFSVDSLQTFAGLAPNNFEEVLHDLPTLSDYNPNNQHDVHDINYGVLNGLHDQQTMDCLSPCSISPLSSQNGSPRDPITLTINDPIMLTNGVKVGNSLLETSAQTNNMKVIQSIHSSNIIMNINGQNASTYSPTTFLQENFNNKSKDNTILTHDQPNDTSATQHMIAERKRRRRQSESFKALKALVPTINKRDKVTILEHSLQYIKQLKDRVEELEQQKNNQDIHPSQGIYEVTNNIVRDSKQNVCHDNQDIHSRSTSNDIHLPRGHNSSVSYHSFGPPCTFLLTMCIEVNLENTNDIIIKIVDALIKKEFCCIHLESSHSSSYPKLNIKLITREKEMAARAQQNSSTTMIEIEDWWRNLTLSIIQCVQIKQMKGL